MVRVSPIRLPSFRRLLVRIHTDLQRIGSHVRFSFGDTKLSKFEMMVLISEDRRFFRHYGFDLISIIREVVRFLTFRRHGGASTIDMQFVRTVTGYRERKLSRKLYEILLAWLIQFRFSKVEILRAYLSCAFFGSRLIGAEAAARKMFQKDSAMLDENDAAKLAAMLVYPRPLSPSVLWQAKIERRANYIVRIYPRMKKRFEKLPRSEMIDRFRG